MYVKCLNRYSVSHIFQGLSHVSFFLVQNGNQTGFVAVRVRTEPHARRLLLSVLHPSIPAKQQGRKGQSSKMSEPAAHAAKGDGQFEDLFASLERTPDHDFDIDSAIDAASGLDFDFADFEGLVNPAVLFPASTPPSSPQPGQPPPQVPHGAYEEAHDEAEETAEGAIEEVDGDVDMRDGDAEVKEGEGVVAGGAHEHPVEWLTGEMDELVATAGVCKREMFKAHQVVTVRCFTKGGDVFTACIDILGLGISGIMARCRTVLGASIQTPCVVFARNTRTQQLELLHADGGANPRALPAEYQRNPTLEEWNRKVPGLGFRGWSELWAFNLQASVTLRVAFSRAAPRHDSEDEEEDSEDEEEAEPLTDIAKRKEKEPPKKRKVEPEGEPKRRRKKKKDGDGEPPAAPAKPKRPRRFLGHTSQFFLGTTLGELFKKGPPALLSLCDSTKPALQIPVPRVWSPTTSILGVLVGQGMKRITDVKATLIFLKPSSFREKATQGFKALVGKVTPIVHKLREQGSTAHKVVNIVDDKDIGEEVVRAVCFASLEWVPENSFPPSLTSEVIVTAEGVQTSAGLDLTPFIGLV